jgi:hypothetical protein
MGECVGDVKTTLVADWFAAHTHGPQIAHVLDTANNFRSYGSRVGFRGAVPALSGGYH